MIDSSLAQSLFGYFPNQQTVTLSPKTASGSPDVRATSVTLTGVRRRPATLDDAIAAGLTTAVGVIMFSVPDDGSNANFRAPDNEDTITDPNGLAYTVRKVKTTVFDKLYVCTCTPNWVSS